MSSMMKLSFFKRQDRVAALQSSDSPAAGIRKPRDVNKEQRFREIDLLRFLAAFSVVLFHYTFRSSGPDHRSVLTFPDFGTVFKYGYLGVELFFIVSGFVILLTALNRNAREFVVSRVTRLYPAYWSCVTITFVAILILGGERYSATIWQYFVNLTMMQEFVKIPAIDSVYWTLTIELKFYFLVFLLVLMGQIRYLQYFLGAWIVTSVFLSYYEGYNGIRFFLFPGYSYFFIAGATFLLIRINGINLYRLFLLATSYIGALFFAVADSKSFADYFRSSFNPIIIVLILSLFFGLFLLIATGKTKWLDRQEFVLFGMLTYPLYLLHQNIGFMMFNAASPYVPRYVLLVATIALVIGLSYAVHRWIERRYSGKLKNLMIRLLLLTR